MTENVNQKCKLEMQWRVVSMRLAPNWHTAKNVKQKWKLEMGWCGLSTFFLPNGERNKRERAA